MEKLYVDTVRLLLQTAPEIFRVPAFALKGGTALNLFVHDMPRLPALKWKLQNLQKLAKSNPTKLRQQADDLRSRL